MTDEPEYKWIRTDRDGHCAGCRTKIESGEMILWSLLDKRRTWCQECGERSGVVPLPNPLPTVSTVKVLPTLSKATSTQQSASTTTPTPTVPSREDKIAAAHAENMSANVALVAAVLELARQVEERSRLLKKQMEAKP
jgi:hypothetical protein